MTIKRFYFFILAITLVKYGIAAVYCRLYGADFGTSFLGYDEINWQDASLFFVEEGINQESIAVSMGVFQSFNIIGWPVLIALVHIVIGTSYYNVILLKAILFFASACCLYSLLLRTNHSKKVAVISVIFLSCYYPLAACDRTFLRDDILVYVIIILLRLSINLQGAKLFIKIPLIVLFCYLLVFSRPISLLVYIVLNLFYFKINKPFNFFIALVVLLAGLSTVFDVVSYGYNFLLTFRPSITSLLFNTFKFYIGPLPWNMFYFDSEYEPYWFIITFPAVILSFFLKDFYISLAQNWKPILGLYIVGFLPYLIGNQEVDLIGPRQFAMTGFFLFIIIYHNLIVKISFNLKPDVTKN